MSLAVRPVFDTPVRWTVRPPPGEILAEEMEALEVLAADDDVPPLSAFSDPREIPPDFDGTPDELDDPLGPCDVWFDAAAGAQALKRLAAIARTRSHVLQDPSAVAQELEDLAAALEAGGRVGARFRLDLMG